jgi:undecaprenyl-diphosphatase
MLERIAIKMIEVFNAVILGIIQGLTEFLPISSSGHLVIAQKIFSIDFQDNHLMNVVLHLGTVVAIIIVFKEELIDIFKTVFSKRIFYLFNIRVVREDQSLWLILIIVIGTIPAAIIGLFFRDSFILMSGSLVFVSFAFLVTGFILFSTRFIKGHTKDNYNNITMLDTIIIGFLQGIAITPGISRSGITISGGLWRSIKRNKIGRYSFLLSLPAILGANIIEFKRANIIGLEWMPLLVGFVVSFIFGYWALKVFLSFVNRGQLHNFSYYCWAIGIISLISYYTI